MVQEYIRTFATGFAQQDPTPNQTHWFYQPGSNPGPVGIATDMGALGALGAAFLMPTVRYTLTGAGGVQIPMSGRSFEIYVDKGDGGADFLCHYPCAAAIGWQYVNFLAVIANLAGWGLNKNQRLGIYHPNDPTYGRIGTGEFFFLSGWAGEKTAS